MGGLVYREDVKETAAVNGRRGLTGVDGSSAWKLSRVRIQDAVHILG